MLEYKFCIGEKDFADAAALRQQIFVEEQGFANEFDDIDQRAIHLVVYREGKPAATARAFVEEGDPADQFTIGRVAVAKEMRMYGLGKAAMLALHEHLKSIGAKQAVLSAQCQAQGFYSKLGYEAFGEVYLDEHCPHQSMKLLL